MSPYVSLLTSQNLIPAKHVREKARRTSGYFQVKKIDGFRLFEPIALFVLQELLFAFKADFSRQLLDFYVLVFSSF
jgi:hypothetical protein